MGGLDLTADERGQAQTERKGGLATANIGCRIFFSLCSKVDINDITYRINGAVFEVNRELGHGFLEKIYEHALLIELRQQGLKAESQVPLKVFYKGQPVGEYFADIVVEGLVIIEVKTVEVLLPVHEAQLLHYLKATGKNVGLLVNFKHMRAEIKRMVLNLPEG